MSSRHLAGSSRNARRGRSRDKAVLTLVWKRVAANEPWVGAGRRERLPMMSSAAFTCSRSIDQWTLAGSLRSCHANIAGYQWMWSASPPLRDLLRVTLFPRRSSRAASGPRNCMTSPNLLYRSQSLWQLFLHWPRSTRLRNGQRPCHAREHRHGNAGQYQTGQDCHRQYIVLYALPGRGIRASEDNALHFVV